MIFSMKTATILFSLMVATLLTQGCNRDTYSFPDMGRPFSLAKSESRQLSIDGALSSAKPTGDKLTFRLTDLNDSRCPANVQCVWAGEAKTSVELEFRGGKTGASLKLGGDRKSTDSDSVAVAVGGRSFTVLLRDVQPYPGTTNDTPRATFVVR